jgi:hypothetical protein
MKYPIGRLKARPTIAFRGYHNMLSFSAKKTAAAQCVKLAVSHRKTCFTASCIASHIVLPAVREAEYQNVTKQRQYVQQNTECFEKGGSNTMCDAYQVAENNLFYDEQKGITHCVITSHFLLSAVQKQCLHNVWSSQFDTNTSNMMANCVASHIVLPVIGEAK